MTPSALLIVDFEATCDDHGRLPAAEMEIIEIGAVLLDEAHRVAGRFQCFAKPVHHPVLTRFCTALTGIRQSDVDSAAPFPEAAGALRQWLRVDPPAAPAYWASWGDYDRRQLTRDCARHRVADPIALPHHNIKKAFETLYGGRGWTLSEALAHRNLAFKGALHRGLDDALNIARLVQRESALTLDALAPGTPAGRR